MADGLLAPPDREEINLLPIVKYRGPVRVVYNAKDLPKIIGMLRKEALLGFDIECRPSFSKGESYPPALLQLAAAEEVFLFPLRSEIFLEALIPIFSDSGIIKAGVAISDDLKKLQALKQFTASAFVDLGAMASKAGLQASGIRTLAAQLLGWRISKGERCSNWERTKLSSRQLTYAATDAWISRRLYLHLDSLLKDKASIQAD